METDIGYHKWRPNLSTRYPSARMVLQFWRHVYAIGIMFPRLTHMSVETMKYGITVATRYGPHYSILPTSTRPVYPPGNNIISYIARRPVQTLRFYLFLSKLPFVSVRLVSRFDYILLRVLLQPRFRHFLAFFLPPNCPLREVHTDHCYIRRSICTPRRWKPLAIPPTMGSEDSSSFPLCKTRRRLSSFPNVSSLSLLHADSRVSQPPPSSSEWEIKKRTRYGNKINTIVSRLTRQPPRWLFFSTRSRLIIYDCPLNPVPLSFWKRNYGHLESTFSQMLLLLPVPKFKCNST